MKYLASIILSGLLMSTSVTYAQASSTTAGTSSSNTLSYSAVMTEIGNLTNQESNSLAEEKQAGANSIKEKASSGAEQAKQTTQGATEMITAAKGGLAVGVATTAIGAAGEGQAAKDGDASEAQEEAENSDRAVEHATKR